ncbi:MAG: bifunctional nicotinamidase/pyrazinamidase [Candidatus Lokiarchaeota archaeon]|nr:bifunctional nicotinamidase/pyrazinamidase [Candidatus Lokiarchaeota archaeon]
MVLKNKIKINRNDALLVVDMQYDFIPGGALPVKDGDKIIDLINQLIKTFKLNQGIIIFSQDWHPSNHLSFASNHLNKNPGDEFQSKGIGPVLWPDHCIQGTKGASFHKNLKIEYVDKIIQKGLDPNTDSYSAFRDQLKDKETELRVFLNEKNIKRLFICGLALDYCCYYTAIDGLEFGFDVYFIIDASKGVDIPKGNISDKLKKMKESGVKFVNNQNFL